MGHREEKGWEDDEGPGNIKVWSHLSMQIDGFLSMLSGQGWRRPRRLAQGLRLLQKVVVEKVGRAHQGVDHRGADTISSGILVEQGKKTKAGGQCGTSWKGQGTGRLDEGQEQVVQESYKRGGEELSSACETASSTFPMNRKSYATVTKPKIALVVHGGWSGTEKDQLGRKDGHTQGQEGRDSKDAKD
ncbi:hypothetical protein P7K49_027956 [Saguinus oedipus]|uniref:Uncharacterized protein n=1 Tax=Saguinus oedipus TaxID=9490 RepID=A0ABQ9UAX2_SAGOE|nr:hypothetical protein P7K49_027956 [Saguinus oedipus]